MTKFLLTTAGVAAVLTLLSGGRRYQSESLLARGRPPSRPQGPRGRPGDRSNLTGSAPSRTTAPTSGPPRPRLLPRRLHAPLRPGHGDGGGARRRGPRRAGPPPGHAADRRARRRATPTRGPARPATQRRSASAATATCASARSTRSSPRVLKAAMALVDDAAEARRPTTTARSCSRSSSAR